MISTAELLVGLSRHLGTYTLGPDRAALGSLEFSGNVLEIAIRLRGSVVSTMDRVSAIALDAGVPRRSLVNEILPTLETLGWLEVNRDKDSRPASVSEQIPPTGELLAYADRILEIAVPDDVELAVLEILKLTIRLPVTRKTALEAASGLAGEGRAKRALDYLEALHLVSSMEDAGGAAVVFNPNIWSATPELAAAAVRAEDGTVRRHLADLIDEVTAHPGVPEDSASEPQAWIDYAVAQGLIDRSKVVTSDDVERSFLFAPQLGASAFESGGSVDPSGHVKQLVGSMVFAKNFASFKLRLPAVFLRRLLRDGEAGDASSIGSDYPMLETAGIVRVEPASRFYKLVLLQADVAEDALNYLEDPVGGAEGETGGIRDQRRYIHPERQRAKGRVELGRQADTKSEETQRLVAALRETLRRD